MFFSPKSLREHVADSHTGIDIDDYVERHGQLETRDCCSSISLMISKTNHSLIRLLLHIAFM